MNAKSHEDEKIITEYGNCPNLLEEALEGLEESSLDLRQSPESWSIRQIVHHVVDGDDLWKAFIKQASGDTGGEFSLAWYWQSPQDEWVIWWGYQKRRIEPSLAMLRASRNHTVQLLREVPGAMEKWLRICPPNGEEEQVSVRQVVEMQTRHVLEHAADIRKIREKHGV